jgi:hypothetical protein
MNWLPLHDEFMALKAEEDKLTQRMDTLSAYGAYEQTGEYGQWSLAGSGSITGSLRARFQLRATEGGIGLGIPANVLPIVYWLHSLHQHLRQNKNHHTSIGGGETGGSIKRVIEASALYCAHLQQKALERMVLTQWEQNYHATGETLAAPQQLHANAPRPLVVQPERATVETTGAQINRWRAECGLTIEGLATRMGLDTRSVQRHLADEHKPQDRHLTAYNRVFSKLLKKEIVINKTP